jgi:hypothetical protein
MAIEYFMLGVSCGICIYLYCNYYISPIRINNDNIQKNKIYKAADIITSIKQRQKDGVELFLDFYPKTNYYFYIFYDNDNNKTIRIFKEIFNGFKTSSITLREHLNIINLNNNCYIELNIHEENYLKLIH